jgi:hypothetical protein
MVHIKEIVIAVSRAMQDINILAHLSLERAMKTIQCQNCFSSKIRTGDYLRTLNAGESGGTGKS